MNSNVQILNPYQICIAVKPLSNNTKRIYVSRIKQFLIYLDNIGEDLHSVLRNSGKTKLNVVLEKYKKKLKSIDKASSNTINSHLTAIDHLIEFLGFKKPSVSRELISNEVKEQLSAHEQELFLQVLDKKSSKQKAIALLIFHSGITLSECQNLDLDDIVLVGPGRKLKVRSGKNKKHREMPLRIEAANAINDWLLERSRIIEKRNKVREKALFINSSGNRLTPVGIELSLRTIGKQIDIKLSAQILRNTFITELNRKGFSPQKIRELSGHLHLDSVYRYCNLIEEK